jgi:hypothetical protein
MIDISDLLATCVIKAVNLLEVSDQIGVSLVVGQALVQLNFVLEDLLYVKIQIRELILVKDLCSVAHLGVYFEKF